MSVYTLKIERQKSKAESQKSATLREERLVLLNEQGEAVSPLNILKESEPYRVFAFDGKMGAGKTTFIKELCEAMGTGDVVNSPTFAIVNVYDVEHPYRGEVYHFDCYRLKDIREAIDFGAEEYLYSGNYCFIEWPDIIAPLLPEDTVWVKICVEENGERKMVVERTKDECTMYEGKS